MLQMTPLPGDWWEQMNIDDIAVKIWLPEPMEECLTTLSDRFNQSKSDLARNALMLHVYGRFVFERLVANRQWKLNRREEGPELIVKYNLEECPDGPILEDAPRPSFIKDFGKNTYDLKVWMPRRLQCDLFSLALRQ